jgi:hypothetical protein
MRTLNFLSTILTFSILLFSCNKEAVKIEEEQQIEDLKIFDGTYTGTFIVQYSLSTKTGPVTLELNNGKHICSGNNDRIPAGGSGTFSTKNGKITFIDKMAWSADFDHYLVLNGQYNYSFDGKKLTISVAKNNVGQYEYKFDKN